MTKNVWIVVSPQGNRYCSTEGGALAFFNADPAVVRVVKQTRREVKTRVAEMVAPQDLTHLTNRDSESMLVVER